MTTKAVLAVFSNPASPEQEAEYNDWYNTTHLDELMAVPGIVAATRYRVADGPGPAPTHRYVAVYELDREPAEVLTAMRAQGSTMSPALDRQGIRMEVWEAVPGGERRG